MKTAVQLAIEKINDEIGRLEILAQLQNTEQRNKGIVLISGLRISLIILKDLLEIEKQQLYNFYVQGGIDCVTQADRTVEDFYNETFKSE